MTDIGLCGWFNSSLYASASADKNEKDGYDND